MRAFGKCLIVEGVQKPQNDSALRDLYIIMWALRHLTEIAGMKLIEPPRPVLATTPPPRDGWTVSATMEESSIAIHSFPSQDYIRLLIDACSDFDEKKIAEEFKDIFNLKTIRSYVVTTGGL